MPNPNLAQQAAVLVTIPNACRAVTINPSGSLDLAAVNPDEGVEHPGGNYDLRGRWVFLEAVGADIRVLRDTGAIVWPNGFLLIAGAQPRDFFVDPDGATLLQAVTSGGAATLLVHFDGEVR